MVLQVVLQGLPVQFQQHAVGGGQRAGAARLVVEQRQFAKIFAARDVLQRDPPRSLARQVDVDVAALDDVHGVAGIALLEHGNAGREGPAFQVVGERPQVLARQALEQFDRAQQRARVRGRRHRDDYFLGCSLSLRTQPTLPFSSSTSHHMSSLPPSG
jgi:hypothetical protein